MTDAGVPGGPGWATPLDAVTAGLFERRMVSLRGVLDDELAGRVAAQLMMLDASGDGSVVLLVDSGEGSLEAAFTVMDTIDLLGVPVHATCMGRADGPAVGVVAVAHRRRASRHARFHLTAPRSTIQGTAADIERWVGHHQSQLAAFVARLAQATGRPVEHVEADVWAGRYLTAEEAVEYGLIDELWSQDQGRPPGSPPAGRPPFGFRPGGRPVPPPG